MSSAIFRKFEIITCPQWGARKPKSGIQTVNKAEEVIFHHTAGHHREISLPHNESRAEAIRYAKDVQNFHMDGRGWIDSGHNFLICRNGLILQGRWLTVSAIQAQHMVVSAHCPQHNDDVGIEHEHKDSEEMTPIQKEASAWCQAWVAWQYGRKTPLPVNPHSKYFATSCPVNLKEDIVPIRKKAQEFLTEMNL